MTALAQKKEVILEGERAFANAIGAAVFEKPQVTFWMILIPILFLHFIYRMEKFKSGRMKFDAEFMVTRRRAMDAALNALAANVPLDRGELIRDSGLPAPLQEPYGAWVETLADHYRDLLLAEGESFPSLVRAAYGNRTNFLLTMNRLNTVEREFYAALKPHLDAAGAAEIIATIEAHSQRLRREQAEAIFS